MSKKLNLNDFKIRSFVTSEKARIKGGSYATDPRLCLSGVDTCGYKCK